MNLDDFSFEFVCAIEPLRDDAGIVKEFMPQKRYRREAESKLHTYGNGPFCRFGIPSCRTARGVYAFKCNEEITYIGRCTNLATRFNLGYGIISPRNCYKGGQETNCRINSIILNKARDGLVVTLWFLKTDDDEAMERKLISAFRPPWNRSWGNPRRVVGV